MSGNLWMFSDMLDDEDIEMQKHDFITLYQGADYYGLGLKSFTRMTREAGAVYKIGKKVLIAIRQNDMDKMCLQISCAFIEAARCKQQLCAQIGLRSVIESCIFEFFFAS